MQAKINKTISVFEKQQQKIGEVAQLNRKATYLKWTKEYNFFVHVETWYPRQKLSSPTLRTVLGLKCCTSFMPVLSAELYFIHYSCNVIVYNSPLYNQIQKLSRTFS